MIDHTERGQPVTWQDACVLSSIKNYNSVRYRTIMQWFLDLHSTVTGDLQFTKSARGESSWFASSPFSEDESLLAQFKAWTRSDLQQLTMKRQ